MTRECVPGRPQDNHDTSMAKRTWYPEVKSNLKRTRYSTYNITAVVKLEDVDSGEKDRGV